MMESYQSPSSRKTAMAWLVLAAQDREGVVPAPHGLELQAGHRREQAGYCGAMTTIPVSADTLRSYVSRIFQGRGAPAAL